MFSNADDALKFIDDQDVKFIDVRFCDLPGVMQHFNVPASRGRRGVLRQRSDVRRLVDPRLPGDQRVRHEADPGPVDRVPRPVPGREDAERQLQHRRPVHGRALQPRPAPGRPQGRGLPALDRHRRHRVLRARGRVLRLRRRPVRDEAERGLLPHRLHRGRLEHGPDRGGRQPGLQDAVQGRVLPGAAGRPLRRPARPDHPRAGRPRAQGRAGAPRGRHGRPGRDQLPVRHAAEQRRQGHDLQVRREERRHG